MSRTVEDVCVKDVLTIARNGGFPFNSKNKAAPPPPNTKEQCLRQEKSVQGGAERI
jgi:hypothetical protein